MNIPTYTLKTVSRVSSLTLAHVASLSVGTIRETTASMTLHAFIDIRTIGFKSCPLPPYVTGAPVISNLVNTHGVYVAVVQRRILAFVNVCHHKSKEKYLI